STPRGLGGPGGEGTNPEQLFAAGYSACFLSALKFVAGRQKVALPDSTSVTADIDIGPLGGGFGLQATLTISAPGVDRDTLQALVEQAHQVCPYSNATRGNIEVDLRIAERCPSRPPTAATDTDCGPGLKGTAIRRVAGARDLESLGPAPPRQQRERLRVGLTVEECVQRRGEQRLRWIGQREQAQA